MPEIVDFKGFSQGSRGLVSQHEAAVWSEVYIHFLLSTRGVGSASVVQ